MTPRTTPAAGPLARRRLARARRAADKRAVRAEFELERPRGFARLRAFADSVGELERARIASHRAPEPARVGPAAARSRSASR